MNTKALRNHTLDVTKLLAAFLVVFIHVPFHGVFGEIVVHLSRVAVPIFFMTSGYFAYKNTENTLLRKAKKLVGILLFAIILYNLIDAALAFFDGGTKGVLDHFLGISYMDCLKLAVFNLPPFSTRLWFLFALIYVYLLHLLFNKLKFSNAVIFVFSLCALAVHFLLGDVLPAFGVDIPDYAGRNFLLFGYPFFCLGLFFRRNEEKILQTSPKILILCALLGCVLSLAPMFYTSVSQISIGTLLLLFAIFVFSLQKADLTYPSWVLALCECSLGIYIFHRPVTTVLNKFFSVITADSAIISGFILPPLVCICTTVFVLILKTIQKKQKAKKPAE